MSAGFSFIIGVVTVGVIRTRRPKYATRIEESRIRLTSPSILGAGTHQEFGVIIQVRQRASFVVLDFYCVYAAYSTAMPAVVEPTRRAGEAPAATQRCSAPGAWGEAPGRSTRASRHDRCHTNEPISPPRSSPSFPAVVRGHYERTLQVALHSGSPVNLISESVADELELDIVVSDFADFIDADEPFLLPPDIVGLTCFCLFHNDIELWYDGFVVPDHALSERADVCVGAPFMEENDISIRPSKRQIMFGDDDVYVYDMSECPAHLTRNMPTDTQSSVPILRNCSYDHDDPHVVVDGSNSSRRVLGPAPGHPLPLIATCVADGVQSAAETSRPDSSSHSQFAFCPHQVTLCTPHTPINDHGELPDTMELHHGLASCGTSTARMEKGVDQARDCDTDPHSHPVTCDPVTRDGMIDQCIPVWSVRGVNIADVVPTPPTAGSTGDSSAIFVRSPDADCYSIRSTADECVISCPDVDNLGRRPAIDDASAIGDSQNLHPFITEAGFANSIHRPVGAGDGRPCDGWTPDDHDRANADNLWDPLPVILGNHRGTLSLQSSYLPQADFVHAQSPHVAHMDTGRSVTHCVPMNIDCRLVHWLSYPSAPPELLGIIRMSHTPLPSPIFPS